jgi:hypothetical protein
VRFEDEKNSPEFFEIYRTERSGVRGREELIRALRNLKNRAKRSSRTRRTHQSSSKSEEPSEAGFEDEKNSSELFEI